MLRLLVVAETGKERLLDYSRRTALVFFAFALTKIDASNAGRVYAAYGGIYILSSILWLWLVENVKPDRWDLLGVSISLVGTIVILFSPHQR